MENQSNSKKQLLTTLAILIVIVVIVGAVILTKKNTTSDSAAMATKPASESSQSQPSSSTNSGAYKDGTYTATGSYISPGGNEDITVTVKLENGIVTNTSAQSGAHEAEGREFQSQFISGYKSKVVGKNIDEISLSHVSGSSLTSQGFNDALQEIKSAAKS